MILPSAVQVQSRQRQAMVEFDLAAFGDGEIIARMDVWLQTEGAAKAGSFGFRLVSSPQRATPMNQDNAREAMHGANRQYHEYSWEMESGFKSGEFVVHRHTK
ncbi:MAG: hypothetical protein DMG77_19015 [Acidobacteria bacterium]|nr:MAG: hypothetical protein DMG77_19015 [Acidobacteriota bacterium]